MATFDTWGGSWGTSWLLSWFREVPVVVTGNKITTTAVFRAPLTTGELSGALKASGVFSAPKTLGRLK